MKVEKRECRPSDCRYRKNSDRFEEFYHKLYVAMYPEKQGVIPYTKVAFDNMIQDVRKLKDSLVMLKALYTITVIIMVITLIYFIVEGI